VRSIWNPAEHAGWGFLLKRPRQEANCQGPCTRAFGAEGLGDEDPGHINKYLGHRDRSGLKAAVCGIT
jgi:hypothetical protein